MEFQLSEKDSVDEILAEEADKLRFMATGLMTGTDEIDERDLNGLRVALMESSDKLKALQEMVERDNEAAATKRAAEGKAETKAGGKPGAKPKQPAA